MEVNGVICIALMAKVVKTRRTSGCIGRRYLRDVQRLLAAHSGYIA